MKFIAWSEKLAKKLAKLEEEIFKDNWSENSILSAINSYAFMGECLVNDSFDENNIQDEDEILGYFGMYLIPPEAHIANIAVNKKFQGKKLSHLIMQKMIDDANKKGCPEMTLEVRTSNTRARNLYEKYGFKIEGIRREYYTDKEDACIYWKR